MHRDSYPQPEYPARARARASPRRMYDNDVGDRATLAMVNYEEAIRHGVGAAVEAAVGPG